MNNTEKAALVDRMAEPEASLENARVGDPANWLSAEFDRARQRRAETPPHARPSPMKAAGDQYRGA